MPRSPNVRNLSVYCYILLEIYLDPVLTKVLAVPKIVKIKCIDQLSSQSFLPNGLFTLCYLKPSDMVQMTVSLLLIMGLNHSRQNQEGVLK